MQVGDVVTYMGQSLKMDKDEEAKLHKQHADDGRPIITPGTKGKILDIIPMGPESFWYVVEWPYHLKAGSPLLIPGSNFYCTTNPASDLG